MTGSAYVLRGVALVTIGILSISACSGPVAVQAPQMTPECEDVMAAAPIRLLGELQRQTDPPEVAALAWGSPPIVLACGVTHRSAPDAQVLTIDGLDWIAETTDDGTVFTTVDSRPTLQVRVPAHYRPEVDAVVEITSALAVR